jgi:hypothetical protein
MTREEQRIVDAILLHARGYHWRVDQHTGPCQWFAIPFSGARPVTVIRVWTVARHAAKSTGVHCHERDLARVIRLVQAQVPLLTYEEWLGAEFSNQPRVRAA